MDTSIHDIRRYGAKGDGVTDDTRAFQAAADAAAGKTLSIPAGTYLVGKIRIGSPMTVTGAGASATLLKERAGNNDSLFVVDHAAHVTFSGLAIDGNLTRQTGGFPHGIQFDGSPYGLVYGIRIVNCEKSAVVAYDGSDHTVVRDSSFAGNENDVEFHMSSYCTASNKTASGRRPRRSPRTSRRTDRTGRITTPSPATASATRGAASTTSAPTTTSPAATRSAAASGAS
jgi:hypothetical protein